jgi:hypothetical protein
MLRTTGWPRHKGAKRPRSVSLKEAACMIASGATPADVARQLGCSRLRLLRLINHDARFKAMLAQLVGEQVAESQTSARTRISSRSGAKYSRRPLSNR